MNAFPIIEHIFLTLERIGHLLNASSTFSQATSGAGGSQPLDAGILLDMPAVTQAAEYLADRLEPHRTWYDRHARQARAAFFSMRTCAVIGSCIVPVLINLQDSSGRLLSDDLIVRCAVTIISMTVGINIALEGVFHFREQWRIFRTTEQMLAQERVAFSTRTGAYRGLSAEDAFALLVSRAEKIIFASSAVALRALSAKEATDTPGSNPWRDSRPTGS
jgi:hypothetical protein